MNSNGDTRGVTVRLERIGIVRQGRDGEKAEILRDASFSARSGEITAIVGPSGGGKSSLIRLINRLNEPSSGKVFLDGEEIASIDPLLLRRRVAMVLQKPFMFEGTVLSNLQRPFLYRQEPLPVAESHDIRHVMELARLAPALIERDSRTLSLGEQQRVSLARALITRPQVLLLDEPTSALDRPTADRLAATFHDICRSQLLTVILVTHDLRLAGRIADYLLYLEGGRILEEGRAEELLSRPRTAELRRFLAEPLEKEP
ncbi:MAG: ATP-binding cassette domain-containing protein [Deltaproteobacteria bacterium]|nr:ATP-binding cassette domain-containing protein [Deltaproteobacteria bacterium]